MENAKSSVWKLKIKHITQGQLESPEKQNAAQLTVMEKTLSSYCTYAMRSISKNIPYLLNPPRQISRIPTVF